MESSRGNADQSDPHQTQDIGSTRVSNGHGASSGHGTLPITACRRCRKQKLRCTRETPICRRCQAIGATCEYPPPPDRKFLAQQRVQAAKERTQSEKSTGVLPQRRLPALPFTEPSFPNRNQAGQDGTGVTQSLLEYGGDSSYTGSPGSTTLGQTSRAPSFPPKEMALYLIEVYFAHSYLSNLLFHKQTFLLEYHAGKTPDFIAMSMFALGSVFLRDHPTHNHVQRRALGLGISQAVIEEASQKGDEWATTASQKALMDCDKPRPETIQACQNLGSYWFSQGQTDRTNIHTQIAYRTARLLRYHRPSSEYERNTLQSEHKRRMFWSTFISSCISQDNASFKQTCWKAAINLPLPCDEASYRDFRPSLREYFDSDGNLHSIAGSNNAIPNLSILAEMAKFLGLWWEIQRVVKAYATIETRDFLQLLSSMQALDHRLDTLFDKLNSIVQFEAPGPASSVESYLLFVVHCLYHLCVCTLSSSLVPLFSSIASNSQVSKKLSRVSAEETIKHSNALLDIASSFVRNGADVSKLPSMTGFALFVAATVQFKALSAQGKLQGRAMERMYPAIRMIQELKGYWRPLAVPWTSLQSLFGTVGLEIDDLEFSNVIEGDGSQSTTNIDQIITHHVPPDSGATSKIYSYIEDEELRPVSHPTAAAVFNNRNKSSSQYTYEVQTSMDKDETSRAPEVSNSAEASSERVLHQSRSTRAHGGFAADNESVQHEGSGHSSIPLASILAQQLADTTEAANASNPSSDAITVADDMDVDASSLWWDQAFELVTDQYGFLVGGYPPPL